MWSRISTQELFSAREVGLDLPAVIQSSDCSVTPLTCSTLNHFSSSHPAALSAHSQKQEVLSHHVVYAAGGDLLSEQRGGCSRANVSLQHPRMEGRKHGGEGHLWCDPGLSDRRARTSRENTASFHD